MMQLVMDDFAALDLAEYGVEIYIDDLSKEEIVDYLEQENFNSLAYMKQDYENFKKYINSQDAPRHMDYLNNDCAPDLQRFMSIKIGGKKTGCYYEFLSGIEEENFPIFSQDQVSFLKYASALLPLVRPHEFLIIKALLDGTCTEDELMKYCYEDYPDNLNSQLEHALQFMIENKVVKLTDYSYDLNVALDGQFK